MTEEYNYYVADESAVILLSSQDEDLIIKMCNTFTDEIDSETMEWLACLQQGVSSLLQLKLQYVQDLGDAALLSYSEGIKEVMDDLKATDNRRIPKKGTLGPSVVSIFPEDRTPKGDN
jgi:hypothetical protein